jgi:hypothetical protein
MTKTAADVEREVEASRSDLDRTVEALKDKMTPGQLFDEASRAMGGAGQQVLSKFVEQAKENPMPLAVMGLGLAWLMSSSGKKGASGGGAYRSGYGPGNYPESFDEPRSFASDGAGGGLADKAHALSDKASDAVSGAKDRLSSVKGAAGESARRAAETVGSAAGAVMDKAGAYGHQAQQTFSQVLESEPLLIGAVGLLVGAAIGAALPSTEIEDRTVGPMRDKLLQKGKGAAQEGLQQAGEVAQAAYGSVKEELTKPSDGDVEPADRAREVVRNAVQAGREQMQGPPN